MAGKKPSKTTNKANAAAAPKRKGEVELSPDMSRLVPTGIDRPHAYVFDVDGKCVHAPVGSDRFFEAILTLKDTIVTERVAAQAEALEEKQPNSGWLKAAGLLRGTWVEEGTPEPAAEAVEA
jgi:hypothetical protein